MTNDKMLAGLSALALSMCLSPVAHAADAEYSLSVGYDQSTGEYGSSETTDMKFVPVTVKVERDQWTVKVTVPWLEIDGPGSLIADGEIVAGVDARRSGIGDTTVSFAYLVYPWYEGGPFLELTAKVKAPTADEKEGLGTGEIDYTSMVSVFQPMGKGMIFGDLGYRVRGSSDLFDLEDGFLGSVGGSYKFAPKNSAGLIYSFRESATGSSEDPADIMGYVTVKTDSPWSMTLYSTFGLSDNSPDTSVGLSVKRMFK